MCAAAALLLVPGGHTASFDQDVWDFGDVAGLAAYLDMRDTRLDFTTITDPRWRLVAKEYIYARLAPADPRVAVLPRAYRVPLTLRTCGKRLIEAASWMNWLTGQQIPSLGQVTQDHCDRYLIERGRRKDAAGTVIGTLDDASLRVPAAVIIELASYGELFTADRYARRVHPLAGRSSSQSPGSAPAARTRRRRWARDPAAAARRGALPDRDSGTPCGGPAPAGPPAIAWHTQELADGAPPGPPWMSCTARSRWHLDAGEPLPALGNAGIQARLAMGWSPDDPLLHVSFTALANTAGARQLHPAVSTAGRPPPRRPRPGRPRQAVGTRCPCRHRRRRLGPCPVDRPAGRQGQRATWSASCTPPA